MVNLTWSMSIFELLDRRAKGRLRDIMNILRKDVEGFKVTHCYKKILAGKTIYNGTAQNLSLWDALHLRAKNFSSHCLAIPETLKRVMYKQDIILACENRAAFMKPRMKRRLRFEPKNPILMTSNRNRKLLLYRVTIMHKLEPFQRLWQQLLCTNWSTTSSCFDSFNKKCKRSGTV